MILLVRQAFCSDSRDQLTLKMTLKTNGFSKAALPEELIQILVTIASSWEDVKNPNEIQVIHLSGAMTNEVLQVTWPTQNDDFQRVVLVRIYGQGMEIFFDRDDEIRTFERISEHGQGPQLLGRFSDGRVEEFIHARTLAACDLHNPETSALIAAKMREFHKLDMPGPKTVFLWDRIRSWLMKAKNICTSMEAMEFGLDGLDDEIRMLQEKFSRDEEEIGFCHNDLQYGNIMVNEETRTITFIDYEYASYNPVAYDLANHFCEMAANYHTETPHILDYSKYPGLERRQRFVRAYLGPSEYEQSEEEVAQLVEDGEKYTLANHLLWGLWGIISAHVDQIDFDYMEYARQRFKQYWQRKPALLTESQDFLANGKRVLDMEIEE
ncbi:hypothetical protein Nepgr_002797 [Nepenthes gracilis]|uniref:Choline kinase 1 n=1 Tax=Nepenthes gracilis TaxID=150966 RepID=A0AAD3P7N0_NEPGR|nr:hypothetical protein Nepgr_002797 [Nepenthes gracilis]